jgi:predicted transcriptional regulator of viral defense system
MTLTQAHSTLLRLKRPTITTRDAAAALRIDPAHAAQVLRRLARTEHVVRLGRGRWALPSMIRPFAVPEALTAPKPTYVSLYSALYHHGLIEQIPEVIYAVTLAPTRRVTTPLGTVSLHQVAPRFFTGYEVSGSDTVKIATAEKALVDVLYLGPARSRLFRALPEIELPRGFNKTKARAYLKLIQSASRRRWVSEKLAEILGS